jgi:16S rRNA (cytidine1402-2'-O)-methyltransferase
MATIIWSTIAMPLTAACLWVVATPLGNPEDLSPRARSILAAVPLILAEDTRRTRLLLQACDIRAKRISSFHEHNEAEQQESVLRFLQQGHTAAIVSDAGTPLLSDPGFQLVRACRSQGIRVSPVPGPSAPVTALCAAGIAPLPYSFLGFLPRDNAKRKALFRSFASVPGALVFFERKNRLHDSLQMAAEQLGPRELAICRELTKTHEEFLLGRLEEHEAISANLLGELTIVIGPPEEKFRTPRAAVEALLEEAISCREKPRQTVQRVQSAARGWTGKEIYALLTARNKKPEI